jgi:L-ascorbate metabolism protein UlaG (beta-lactamase superfamily)
MRVLIALCLLAAALPGTARASLCYAFVEELRRDLPGVRYAQLGTPSDASPEAPGVAPRSVRITYVAHSAFRIETEEGVVIVTDYFGNHGAGRLPDVVTMNHAHSTHYTDAPDPGIPNVLRGWNPAGDGPAEHLLSLRDVTIRNVTTDIRGWGAPERDGNSIFIFEVADLCIGHLGHLHHVLDEAQYAKVGYLDIVMAPVDGTYTLDLPGMIEVLKTLKARLVLPMHAFGTYSLEQFLLGMRDEFAVDLGDSPTIDVSFDSLPAEPTVLVLPGAGLGSWSND